MKRGRFFQLLLVIAVLMAANVSAEVLILNINHAEFSTQESVKVFGYVMDDSLTGLENRSVNVSLNGQLSGNATTDSSGYYELYLSGLSPGSFNLTASTSLSQRSLVFTVFPASELPRYEIIAPSLIVPLKVHKINLTIRKYLGDTIAAGNVSLRILYENGSVYSVVNISNNVQTEINLPETVGFYKIIIDGKKSFVVSVSRFNLKFKIVDAGGNERTVFKPGDVAYFEVEGYSNGQLIQNATVTAEITTPGGLIYAIPFSEKDGTYYGNTNITSSGKAINLVGGDYEVEFVMKDSSNNEQKVIGFFSVYGLSVDVELVNKRPYHFGENADFDVVVKDYDDGSLINHSDVSYSLELSKDGKLYDISSVVPSKNPDSTKSSLIVLPVTSNLEDGDYFLTVRADYNGKKGIGKAFLKIRNKELFIHLTDSFGGVRDFFQPGELAKIIAESNQNMSLVEVHVYKKDGTQIDYANATGNAKKLAPSFNVPQEQGDYVAKVYATINGSAVNDEVWFTVQSYLTFMDVVDNQLRPKFIVKKNTPFMFSVKVFDVSNNQGVDLSSFKIKFNRIINPETREEITNFKPVENLSLSNRENGVVVYNMPGLDVPDGPYEMQYTIVDSSGNAINGKGYFGISALDVKVNVLSSAGIEKNVFTPGDSINISVNVGSGNGTATLHRDFFAPLNFNITNGSGSVLLTSSANLLPTQPGHYWFGVEVRLDNGKSGMGDGFFEIRSMNFRSINVRNNGDFQSNSNILADVVVEKAGTLLEGANVSVVRLLRSWDQKEVNFNFTSSNTDSKGRAVVNITAPNLEPGDYFVELRAQKGSDKTFNGFGFRIVGNDVTISIDDEDKKFSSTDTINVKVQVKDKDGNPIPGEIVTLEGFLNLDTWAPISLLKKGNTSSNGIATISVSAASLNAGRYAPIINTSGKSIVGFGDGEFEIKPFDADIQFVNGKVSYEIGENIFINISTLGSVTATASVKDMAGNTYSVDSYFSGDILTLRNSLSPGDYFVDVTVTSGSKSLTKTMWFEVMAPMASFVLNKPDVAEDGKLNINYTVFTSGVTGTVPGGAANGWHLTNATILLESIENMWSGSVITVNTNFSASGEGNYTFDLAPYHLPPGDYLLTVGLEENDLFSDMVYFRVINNVKFWSNITVNGSNVTIRIMTQGMSGNENFTLHSLYNFKTLNTSNLEESNTDGVFTLNNLANGFYLAEVEIQDEGMSYFLNPRFEVFVPHVHIEVPGTALVDTDVVFNITASVNSIFWIIDPVTWKVLVKQPIPAGPSVQHYSYKFTYPGKFIYSSGDNLWEAFGNGQDIRIKQIGLNVQWPSRIRYVVGETFRFNVSTPLNGIPLKLVSKSHFTGETKVYELGKSPSVPEEWKSFNFTIDVLGPQNLKLILDTNATKKPKSFYFIDTYPNEINVKLWPDDWDYKNGENVSVHVDINNITSSVITTPDSVSMVSITGPFGNQNLVPIEWQPGSYNLKFTVPDTWVTGNYHVEFNVTKGSFSDIFPIDIFVNGNDNLDVIQKQERWDYSGGDIFNLTIDVMDSGKPAQGIKARFMGLEKMNDWMQNPAPYSVENDSYWFSNNNVTDENGRIRFFLNLSHIETGYYEGKLLVGGKIVWFSFNVKAYIVDAYTDEWEYGLNSDIKLSVRIKDIKTGIISNQNGTLIIDAVRMLNEDHSAFVNVSQKGFGLSSNTFYIENGEALVEMKANNSILQITQPTEFNVQFRVNTSSGVEYGEAWFRLSDFVKPEITIVDSTGNTPEVFFPDQSYTIRIDAHENLTAYLKNIWGPDTRQYSRKFEESGSYFVVNFTTPSMAGVYDVEVEIMRADGFSESLYKQFVIGSGLQFEGRTRENIIPGMNFTVKMHLFGEGEDPMCRDDDSKCKSRPWFGPLPNRTIKLVKIQDLDTFAERDIAALNIERKTGVFPDWMIPTAPKDCSHFTDSGSCNSEDGCIWNTDSASCYDMATYCHNLNETECLDEEKCMWDPAPNECRYENMPPGKEISNEFEDDLPGDATFELNPEVLNMTPGKRYYLIFQYNDSGEIHEAKVYEQVEKFHIAISRNNENLPPNSRQQVWLKTTDVFGNIIPNCTVQFNGIYSEKDQSLVRNLDINGMTDAKGEFSFNYITPGLPDYYYVKGRAVCNLSGEQYRQDVTYHIDVGSRNLAVDMASKYDYGNNIKIVITTKDRNGKPKSENLEVRLFHTRVGYNDSVYPLVGSDCQPLEAAPESDAWKRNNTLSIRTDKDGHYELKLCPLPRGEYDIKITPVFEFNGPMMSEDDYGFFSSFLVTSIDTEIETGRLRYKTGERVNLNITANDEWGTPMNATIIGLRVEKEFRNRVIPLKVAESPILVTDGFANYSFVIPKNVTIIKNATTNMTVPVGIGPVDVVLLIKDSQGTVHTISKTQFVIVNSNISTVTSDATAMVNSLISVHAETDNAGRYKAQYGSFILTDNPDKEKRWEIEGGTFFRNMSNKSVADFKILTPKEPGLYYLAIPILPIGAKPDKDDWNPIEVAHEVLIERINVKMLYVNVSGYVRDLNNNPIRNALVRIGKASNFTDSNGYYHLEVPIGKKSVSVERKVDDLKEFMESSPIDFNSDRSINITFYEVKLGGKLNRILFNISSPGFDLSTTRLRINLSVNNTGPEALNNFSITGIAMSGEEKYKSSVSGKNTTYVYFSKLYAGFETQDYVLRIKMSDNEWNSSSYIMVDGQGVNSTVGAVIERPYRVVTYAVPGNNLDDDGDGLIDEEINNNKDDDGDGLIDEDLNSVSYVEYCGNGFCSVEEKNSGSCFEDCALGSVCGDGVCDKSELYNCVADCGESNNTCTNIGECNDDGTFCNLFGLKEPVDWCQATCSPENCWACSVEEFNGTNECEKKGCTVYDNGNTKWCDKPRECSADNCGGCTDNASCTATGLCEWKEDEWGGWCERPWVCSAECGACSNQTSCEQSPAQKDGAGCVWRQMENASFCDWNFTYLPPKEGEGIIENVWLGVTSSTEDWQAISDMKNWSGHLNDELVPGSYYLLLRMGGTNVNISVNGDVFATIYNEMGAWGTFATPLPYDFNNGTYMIEIIDLIGPDYVSWNVTFGHKEEAVCGNGIIEAGEDCEPDPLNLSGEDCTSDIFNGAYSGGTLGCTADCKFNTSLCTPVEAGNASLSGQVNGSVIVGANISLYKGDTLMFSVLTNESGGFIMPNVPSGMYDLEIGLPDAYPFHFVEIFIGNINITKKEFVQVMIPHVFYAPFVNGQMGFAEIPAEVPANFSVMINNSNNYTIDAHVELGASETGDTNVYNNSFITLNPYSLGFMRYTFNPVNAGLHSLYYNISLETESRNIFYGSQAFDNSDFEVVINSNPFEVNVSGELPPEDNCSKYTDLLSCTDEIPCGWAEPPGGDPFCISCAYIQSIQDCNATNGCQWNLTTQICEGVPS